MNLKHLLFCCLMPIWGYGQFTKITFDDTNNLDLIMIDTVSNPNNIWQIGKPQKSFFNSSYSDPNVIITDTLNSYPTNDSSSFYLWFLEHKLQGWWPVMEFRFKTNMDSLNDFGEIHFSPDKGGTWHKVENSHPIVTINCNCNVDNPFTGDRSEWTNIFLGFNEWDNYFGYTDSILFKFTFYSDNVFDNKDGWMIDDIRMYEMVSSVKENDKTNLIYLAPNPAQETIRIQFLDPNIRGAQELKIYSITGQLVFYQMINPPEEEINIETLEMGVYMYELGGERGKIVVE